MHDAVLQLFGRLFDLVSCDIQGLMSHQNQQSLLNEMI